LLDSWGLVSRKFAVVLKTLAVASLACGDVYNRNTITISRKVFILLVAHFYSIAQKKGEVNM